MRTILLSVLALAVCAPAMAETPTSSNEKTIFEQSAPPMAEFLTTVAMAERRNSLESALSLLEQERPALERHGVLTQHVGLKAELEQKSESGAL